VLSRGTLPTWIEVHIKGEIPQRLASLTTPVPYSFSRNSVTDVCTMSTLLYAVSGALLLSRVIASPVKPSIAGIIWPTSAPVLGERDDSNCNHNNLLRCFLASTSLAGSYCQQLSGATVTVSTVTAGRFVKTLYIPCPRV
jgi:hypothetical protein